MILAQKLLLVVVIMSKLTKSQKILRPENRNSNCNIMDYQNLEYEIRNNAERIKRLGEELQKTQNKLQDAAACPYGWKKYLNSCYGFMNGSSTWEEASKDIKNKYWIGNSDINEESKWIWATSGANCVYTNWARISDEPNGSTRENCGTLNAKLDYHWNDASCSIRLNFICERQIN